MAKLYADALSIGPRICPARPALRSAPVFAALLFAVSVLRAAAPPGYYDLAQGKTGLELRRALHFIVSGHHVIPYSDSRTPDTSDALKFLDEDADDTNNVLLIYSALSVAKTNFGTTVGWNREHLWPNSYGLDDREPAFSDLHNLRAVDATVNSSRGNKLYDASNPFDRFFRVPGHPEAPQTSTDSDSWEPPDDVKGDVARALFYMAVRYTGARPGEPALFLTDRTIQVLSTTNLMARLTTLLMWHAADPVDDRERLRNDRVFEHYQRNRNPFVDRPEWVSAVFAPRLEIVRVNGVALLQWRDEFALATVEVSLSPNGPWAPLTNTLPIPPITLPKSGFYRLIVR